MIFSKLNSMIDWLIDDFVEKRNWLLSKYGSIVVELKIEASQWGNLGTGKFLYKFVLRKSTKYIISFVCPRAIDLAKEF